MRVTLISLPHIPIVYKFLRVACNSLAIDELQHDLHTMDDFSGYLENFRFVKGEYCIFVVYIELDQLHYICTLPLTETYFPV